MDTYCLQAYCCEYDCNADQALAGMNNEEVATRLRGRAGTSVTLKLRRPVCYKQIHLYITEDDNQEAICHLV